MNIKYFSHDFIFKGILKISIVNNSRKRKTLRVDLQNMSKKNTYMKIKYSIKFYGINCTQLIFIAHSAHLIGK